MGWDIAKKNNKLIAEFMGIESDDAKMRGHLYECPVTAEYVSNLEYDTSWDWLMPVVNKCRKEIGAEENEVGDITHALLDGDRKEIYNAVVEFIKQLNKE